MFRVAKQVLDRHGVLAAAKYAFYRLLQRMVLVDVTHFMVQDLRDLCATETSVDVECRFLTVEEVRSFASDPTNDLDVQISDRLETGYDLCFGGIVDGRLVCYCWFALHSIEAHNNSSTGKAESGVALSFPEQYVFRYKGFTHPDFRGKGLYSQVAFASAAALRARGVQFVLSTAEWTNFSALKSSYRSGFVYAGLVGVVWIWRRRFVFYPGMRGHQGLHFDQQADVLDRKDWAPADAGNREPWADDACVTTAAV